MSSPVKRLAAQAAWLFTVAALASIAVYVVIASAPGAPADLPHLSRWILGALTGDLGVSTQYRVGAEVSGLVAEAAWLSIGIVGLALCFALGASGCLAWLWSGRQHPRWAAVTRAATYIVSASPAFLLAYWVLIGLNGSVAWGLGQGWWDRPSWFPVPIGVGGLRYVLAAAVLAVGSGVLMETARGLSAELDRLLGADFILFARAAGRPLWRHVVPNLVAPVASLAVNRLISLFGGAVVVEVIFNVPGLGRLTWDAALLRDASVLLGATAVWAVLYAGARVVSEAVVVFVDPRTRASAERA